MDREFACPAERLGRMIVGTPPGPSDHKHNVCAGLDQCRSNGDLIALDRENFFDDTAIALDHSADHRPVAVLAWAGLCRLSNQYPNTRLAGDRDFWEAGTRQRPDMTRGKPRPGGHQCRSRRRNRAFVFDIVTSRHCLDYLDPALAVGLGQPKRDDRAGLGRQSIAGS
jgi:hypothetical protein